MTMRGRLMLALIVASLGVHDAAQAGESRTCQWWLGQVARDTVHHPWDLESLTEAEKLKAIRCLLRAENDLRPAAFGGATRPVVSQLFAPARVNLAALYLISWIYTGRYEHADAVALRGDGVSYSDHGTRYATKFGAIHKAYRAYRAWFAKVRRTGLDKARSAGLQPLDGTGLSWY